jgi:ATP-binding cassette subfamily B protein
MSPASEPSSRLPDAPRSRPARLLLRHWRWLALGVLCLVGTNVLAQSVPWLVKRAIDLVSAARGALGASFQHLLILIAAFAVGQAAIRILSRVFIFTAAREAEYELRRDLFARLCRLGAELPAGLRTGDVMSRMTSDLSSVRALFGAGVLHVVNTVFAYAVALPLMLRIDPLLTALALAPYPLLLLAARAFARGIYLRSRETQAALAELSSALQEDLAGIRELKGQVIVAERAVAFRELSARYLEGALRLARFRAALIPVVGLGAGASLLVVLWVGGRAVIQARLGIGDLVAFTLYLGLLTWPTMSIGWMLTLWQRGLASWDRLALILDARSPLEDAAATGSAPLPPHSLELRELTVAGAEGRSLLESVSVTIPAGSLCAVVGRVGSGKSTLAETLARLRDLPPGCLFLGGRDASELGVTSWRRQVAYAPQDAFLFSATIRENIAYGADTDPDHATAASPELRARVERAARAAGLEADLLQLEDGIETLVGERGLSLSGGQRQRIALARALVSDRPILILDDSLSAVDADTERAILAGLADLLEGRTTILITHRLSAMQHADQVVVLEGGRLVERGTPTELLARGGLYAELYRGQLIETELAR